MRTRINYDGTCYELRVHLDMQETRELEETGHVIAVDEEDSGFIVCVTYEVEDLVKYYAVWTKANAIKYDTYGLKLSYTPEQEREDFRKW